MRAVFFSDVHLLREDTDKTRLVREFLKDCCEGADIVFIIGDLFEFYHGYDDYIYPWYRPVADALKTITGKGRKILFLEGNHEFGMGGFFQKYTGVVCNRDVTVDLDGRRIYVSHGDASGLFCLGRVLKTPFIYRIMDILGPMPTWNAANAAGFFLSRNVKAYNEKIRNIFRENARKKLNEGYDAVIYGHSHMCDKVEFDEGGQKKIYLNTGDFGKHCDYVFYETASGFTQQRYERNADGRKGGAEREI